MIALKNDPRSRMSAPDGLVIPFGLVLGLALLKFGNPVILEAAISPPASVVEALHESWPPAWSFWCLPPLGLAVIWAIAQQRHAFPEARWLWVLPLIWFAWQCLSAIRTVDSALTMMTLPHLAGCVLCYLLGALLVRNERLLRLLLIGLLAAFVFCLVRAAQQKLFELPQERLALLEGQRVGWTNFPAEAVLRMKREGFIITTNGMDVVAPWIMQKYDKGRVFGTLVYPNALAGAVLLLLPLATTLAYTLTRHFRPITRWALIILTLFLGIGSLVWSESRSGWLIATVLLGTLALRCKWRARWKWAALGIVLAIGLAAFGLKFHRYFASGATSVSARLDYWRAAVTTAVCHPILGSGPGTFQRPYASLKRPESEMARLVHNDYLEQFSDSGFPGGIAYSAWITLLLLTLWRRTWIDSSPVNFAIFLGLLGWFAQGMSEFGLYIPALAWPAFALAGSCLGMTAKVMDIYRADASLRRK